MNSVIDERYGVAPIADIGKMNPVGRTQIRGVIIQDRLVGCPRGLGEIRILPDIPPAEQHVELVRQPLLIN